MPSRLTEAQKCVLDVFYNNFFTIRSREFFVRDRPGQPETIGRREAFDWLLANGYIAPETEYVITDAGRRLLEQEEGR
jgi:hypothetical protein